MTVALSSAVLICLAYLLFTTVVYVTLTVIGAFESFVRRHESWSADYETLGASRFTIPVSIVVPAYNEERVIAATTRSMLELDYPEYEVIVVNDGSSDATLAALIERSSSSLTKRSSVECFHTTRFVPCTAVRSIRISSSSTRSTVARRMH